MRGVHRFLLWAAMAWSFLTALASAEPAPAGPGAPEVTTAQAASTAAVTQARERFLRGVALAKAQNFDEALAEFNASIALFPTRAALENLALCLTELGRYVDARDAYARISRDYAATASPGELAELKAQIEFVSGHIGRIDVVTVPEGATVIIDGQTRGKTPLAEPIAVDAGSHSVRVFHPGYSTVEAGVQVVARATSQVNAVLEAARRVGTLSVRESSGRSLDVLVNGAIVGKTPYSGPLPPGKYSVSLAGGGGIGTAPSAAQVRADEAVALVLTAGVLDAELRVVPVPSNAAVFIDGVAVGNGVWQGALPHGQHRVDVVADGHRTQQRPVSLRKGERFELAVQLERHTGQAAVAAAPPHRLWAELVGGLAFTPSLGGSADAACGTTVRTPDGSQADGCSERSLPLGFLAGARVGYQVAARLNVDVFFGYLRLTESMTRRIRARFEDQADALYADDYEDGTTLSGATFALAPSYRFLERTPITLRLWFGVGRLSVDARNAGTFRGDVEYDGSMRGLDTEVSVDEVAVSSWVPLVGPEIRVGYVFNRHFSADFGVAALLLMPSDIFRYGKFQGYERRRVAPIDVDAAGNKANVYLPEELALGTALLLAPSFAARYHF